ncbi:glycosyltransferase [Stella sp.]|uniref:glycosyltransferase n=1 Tax=Stella sp. TaxID=2912054 RepID=UPI0035B2A79B
MAEAPPLRVLFYTVNGKGLGHLMRALAIARQMRRLAPATRFLFATSCEDPGVLWREGFHYVKTLTPEAVEAHGRGRERHRAMAERFMRAVFEGFQPDLLVVDSFAYGSVGELRPFLEGPWRRVLVSNLFLLQRDLVRYRESVGHYDLVVYPFLARDARGHPALADLPRPAVFAGPIAGVRPDDLMPRAAARAALGLPADGPIVLVAAGGGGGDSVAPVLARAAAALPLMPDLGFALLEPPLARDLPAIPWGPNVRIVRRVPIAPCLSAFDAAVSTAGMNSAAEMMTAGLPMVWTPLGAPSVDQERNVARWVKAGIGCTPSDPGPEALAAAVRRVLEPATAAAMRQAMAASGAVDGATRAAEAILRSGPRPPPRPRVVRAGGREHAQGEPEQR